MTTRESLKSQVVEGTNAAAVAEHDKKLRTAKKLDGIAQKIIVTTVSDQLLLHIINCQSAREMWQKLYEIFENKSETAKHILQQP